MNLHPTEWCFPCGMHLAEPPVPPGLILSQEDRRAAWIANPPRLVPAFTNPVDPETERLRDLENQRREAAREAKRASLNSFKDEHAERGERWDPKAKAWVRDEKLLKRMREAEFRSHANRVSAEGVDQATIDADLFELQAEPICERADGEPPIHTRVLPAPRPPGKVAPVASETQGSPDTGGTKASRSQSSPKRGKGREVVAMPTVLPPPPPPVKA